MISVTDPYGSIIGFLDRSNKYICNNKGNVGRCVFCAVLESPEVTYCYAMLCYAMPLTSCVLKSLVVMSHKCHKL
jgi:hypothetical protein